MVTQNTDFKACKDLIDEVEYGNPTFMTVVKVVWCSIRSFFVERAGIIIISAFVLIMLWGTHGKLELLGLVWPDWRGPGIDVGNRPQLISGIPWDNELISFWMGAFLLVVIPILIIKFFFRQPLSDYGLGLPPKGRRQLALVSFIFLIAISAFPFILASQNPSMQMTYPFFREFDGIGQFLVYELAYLPFFIAIEFIFRGYLLFGLAGIRDDEMEVTQGENEIMDVESDTGVPGIFYFARYALLIQMLSYTAWHLGKPVPELWGTLLWGLIAGAIAYATRSVWPVILAHWLLNVGLDYLILHFIGIL